MSQRGLAVNRAAAEGAPDPGAEQQRLVSQLVNLVPGESLAAFVALIAATASYEYGTRIWMFVIVLVLTPIYIWLNYLTAAKGADAARLPGFEMLIGTAAFVIWSFSVPKTPFEDKLPFIGGKLSPQDGVIVTLIASIVLGVAVSSRPALRKYVSERKNARARRRRGQAGA